MNPSAIRISHPLLVLLCESTCGLLPGHQDKNQSTLHQKNHVSTCFNCQKRVVQQGIWELCAPVKCWGAARRSLQGPAVFVRRTWWGQDISRNHGIKNSTKKMEYPTIQFKCLLEIGGERWWKCFCLEGVPSFKVKVGFWALGLHFVVKVDAIQKKVVSGCWIEALKQWCTFMIYDVD